MDGEFYVQVVLQDGNLGPLYGPGTWYACVEKVKKLLAAGGEEAIQLSCLELEEIEFNGSFTFEGGGGVYTVCSEPLETEEPKQPLFGQNSD